jgi:hypothetical protein
MQSANDNVDQSLGLAWNVPCRIGTITLYLQIHVIRSPAYDILLGWPFDVLTESTIKNFSNEDQTITIVNPNSKRSVAIPTMSSTPSVQLPFLQGNEELSDKDNDYVLIISLDSSSSSSSIKAYTPISSLNS